MRRQIRTGSGGWAAKGRIGLLALSFACAGALGLGGGAVAGASSSDWPSYLHDAAHSSYNAAATTITPDQAGNLLPIWQWADPRPVNGGYQAFLASPTVVNGVVYIGDDDGRFYAVRESDRSVLWSRYLGFQPTRTCSGVGVAATATVAPDPRTGALTVYENGPDGNLYALDATTGAVVWAAQVDTPSTSISDYFAWSSPLVANGRIYLGVASNCDVPLVKGGLVAFDQGTGARIAFWRSMLSNALGGDIWSTPSVLADGSVVATTGNGAGAQTSWANAIVRLDGSSLSFIDGWQVPQSQQGDDSDFGGSPTLFTAVLNGSPTPMVAACNKNGYVYAFRQSDLHDGPVWSANMDSPGAVGEDMCFAAPLWDGTQLIEAGAGPATVGSSTYEGSVRSFDPATGSIVWQTGLPGGVIGSPTEDGAGLIAAAVEESSAHAYGVYLLRASDGRVVGYVPTTGGVFAQPVFVGNDLLIAGNPSIGLTAFEVASQGPAFTVAPASVAPGQFATFTISGSGFSGSPSVVISGSGVTATAVQVLSSNRMNVVIRAAPTASLGPRDVTVVEPGPVISRCAACLTILPAATTSIVSSINPSTVGAPVTFTATVNPTDGGGDVTFTADGVAIAGCASEALSPSAHGAQAACTTSTLSLRTHSIAAAYSGDANWAASTGALPGGQVVLAPPPPPAPANLVATAQSTTVAGLSWSAVPGATKYLVFSATQSGGPYTRTGTTNSPGTTAVVGGLTPNTAYFFVVQANAGYANSASSNEARVTTPPAPTAPTNLTARIVSSTAVTLAWDAVPGATKYALFLGGTIFATTTATTRTVTGLSPSHIYQFTVATQNAWGISPQSNVATITTPGVPDPPQNLRATSIRTTSITLAWDAVGGATSYSLFESASSGGPYTTVASSTVTSGTVGGLRSHTTYYFVVKAVSPYATSTASHEIAVTTS